MFTCLWKDIFYKEVRLSYLQKVIPSIGIVFFFLKSKKLRIFSFLQRNYREIQAKILSHRFKEIASKIISNFLSDLSYPESLFFK